jgi:hypothetical protein
MPSAHPLLPHFWFTWTRAFCQPQAEAEVPFSGFSWSSSDEFSEGNAATRAAARLDGCDWWREPTAAEGATGAIDLCEEHHDVVRIGAGTMERFD